MDRRAWQATVQRVAKSRTRLGDYARNHNPPSELGCWHLESPVLCPIREAEPGGMHEALLPGHSQKAYWSQRVTQGGRELRRKESTLITL